MLSDIESETKQLPEEPKKPLGRPKKKKLPRGRPKGQEAIMKDYRMRMLNSPKSRKVLDSLFEVATDPDHKHWAAATKMVVDRVVPQGGFTPEKVANGKIEINISGLGASVSTPESDVVDAEYEEVEESD